MVWFEEYLKDHPVLTPTCHEQGNLSLDQAPVQLGLEHFKERPSTTALSYLF